MKFVSKLLQTYYIPVLVLLFVWGIFLRLPELVSRNVLFGLDNGRDYLAAYNIVVHHKLTLIGAEAGSGVAGINGIFHGPGYFYLISLAYILFHGNPLGSEVFMVLFGVAALLFSAKLGAMVAGKSGALLTTFFVAVSYLIVSQSRFIWSSHPITIVVLLALYCVYKIPTNPKLFAPLAVFFAGFSYNSQLGVAVPLTVAVIVSLPLVYRISDWSVYAISFVALLFAYAPMGLFELRHNFMAVRSAISYVAGGGGAAGGSMFSMARLLSHAQDYYNNFINTFTYEFGFIPNNIQRYIVYAATPFVLYGLTLVRGKIIRSYIWFLLVSVLVTWIGYLFLNNVVWDYYLTHTRLAFILLFVLGGIGLYRQIRKNIIAMVGVGFFILLLLSVSVGSAFRMYVSYTQDIHDNNVIDKIQGKWQLIDLIYKDAAGKPFSVFVFTPGVYTYAYDYLFMTYGESKYGYRPTAQKQGLAYLVIEPDQNQPWRSNGWLQTVVEGGSVVWQKSMFGRGVTLIKKQYP